MAADRKRAQFESNTDLRTTVTTKPSHAVLCNLSFYFPFAHVAKMAAGSASRLETETWQCFNSALQRTAAHWETSQHFVTLH